MSIDLDGSNFGTTVTNFDAHNFTQAIEFDSPGFGNQNVTFTAASTGTGYAASQMADILGFGNGNDTVTVGDGANTLRFGTGSNTVTAGNGNNIVTLNYGCQSRR